MNLARRVAARPRSSRYASYGCSGHLCDLHGVTPLCIILYLEETSRGTNTSGTECTTGIIDLYEFSHSRKY